jgi:phospholipid-binding lipoprotein MlaA
MKTPDSRSATRQRLIQWSVCATLLIAVSLQSGCTAARRDGDPFRPMNRVFFHMNMGLDQYIAEPASNAYRSMTPNPVRTGIRNFFTNLAYAPTILYDLLQGHPRVALADAGRLVINTVWGVGGIFDPATRLGLERHPETFGVTVGVWGLPQGPYLVLPLLGPTTFADLPDIPIRILLSPVTYLDSFVRTSATGMGALSEASDEDRSTALDRVRNAVEPYEYLRSGYLQHQEELIRQRRKHGADDDIFPFEDLPTDDTMDDEMTPEPDPTTDTPPPGAHQEPPAGEAPPPDRTPSQ